MLSHHESKHFEKNNFHLKNTRSLQDEFLLKKEAPKPREIITIGYEMLNRLSIKKHLKPLLGILPYYGIRNGMFIEGIFVSDRMLAKKLGCHRSTIIRQKHALEDHDLISYYFDEEDQRQKMRIHISTMLALLPNQKNSQAADNKEARKGSSIEEGQVCNVASRIKKVASRIKKVASRTKKVASRTKKVALCDTNIFNNANYTQINKSNRDSQPETIAEPEDIYLFSCDNNIYEEEEVVEDKPSSQPSVSSETYSEAIQSKCISNYQPNNIASMLATVVSQDANIIVQPSLPVVVEDCDRPEKINSPSEVSASDKLLAEIQQMRARGDIHPDIASSKTDEILVMEAGAHIAEQTLKTSKKTGLNFTYEQGLGSFKAMVKSGAFTTPNSMDAFIQHKLNKDKHKQAQSQKEKDDRLKFLHDHIFRKLHTALLESSQPVRDVNATSFKAAIRANYFIEHEAKEHVDLEKVVELGVKYALKNLHVGQLFDL